MLKIAPVFAYDAPHCISAARKILLEKPDYVAIEAAEDLLPLFERFARGKISDTAFVKVLSGKGGKLDRKVMAGEKLPPLGYPGPSIEYIALAARQVGAKIVPVGMRFSSARDVIRGFIFHHNKNGIEAALRRAESAVVSPDKGLTTFFEFVHSPFHFFELLIGHNPSRDYPGTHPPGCKVCTLGIFWERGFYDLYAFFTNIFNPIGESKYVPAVRYFESLEERKIAIKIARLFHEPSLPKKGKDRKKGKKGTKVLAVLHIWKSRPVLRKLSSIGLKPEYV